MSYELTDEKHIYLGSEINADDLILIYLYQNKGIEKIIAVMRTTYFLDIKMHDDNTQNLTIIKLIT